MDVAMWGKALRVIPRISRAEWDQLDLVSRWLIAARSAVLIITFISAAIAGLLAIRDGAFNPVLWLALAFGLIMAHATNNLLNDLTDYAKGVDEDNYFRSQYGPQPLTHGLLTTRSLLRYAAASGLLALLAGGFLVTQRGTLALALLGLGAFFVLFYTWPLKYVALGELAVLVGWGPLMIGGGYYVVTGRWDSNVALAGLPYALGATTVIFGKHIDKIDDDRAKGIHTLPVLLGEQAARATAIGLFLAQYALVLYLVAIDFFTPLLGVVLLALPVLKTALSVYRRPRPATRPGWYPADAWPLWFVAFAFQHNRRFGLLFLLGLIGEVAVRQVLPLVAR